MTSALTRSIAAFVLVVLAGLPVASVVCARECTLPVASAAADDAASEHCHKPESTDTVVMTAVAPDGCGFLALRDVATRERSASPVAAAAQAALAPHVRVDAVPDVIRVAISSLPPILAARCPSAPIPLRI